MNTLAGINDAFGVDLLSHDVWWSLHLNQISCSTERVLEEVGGIPLACASATLTSSLQEPHDAVLPMRSSL